MPQSRQLPAIGRRGAILNCCSLAVVMPHVLFEFHSHGHLSHGQPCLCCPTLRNEAPRGEKESELRCVARSTLFHASQVPQALSVYENQSDHYNKKENRKMESLPLASRHSDVLGLGCYLSNKVAQKWFHVRYDEDPLHCWLWSGFGPARSQCLACFRSLCSRFGTRKEEKKAAEYETKELQSKELSSKEGEFCWFSHVSRRQGSLCLSALNSRTSSQGLRMKPGQAKNS